MRLVKIDPEKTWRVPCFWCGDMHDAGHLDPDGPAFEAFYCVKCATKLIELHGLERVDAGTDGTMYTPKHEEDSNE